MTDHNDTLARIDAAREAVAEARNHVEHFPITDGDAVRVTRLADIIESLIPEPPRPPDTSDDQREALAEAAYPSAPFYVTGTNPWPQSFRDAFNKGWAARDRLEAAEETRR